MFSLATGRVDRILDLASLTYSEVGLFTKTWPSDGADGDEAGIYSYVGDATLDAFREAFTFSLID